MGGCPMAALALALSVAVSGDARVGHSMPALQRRGAAAANLADHSCAEPINWQLIGCEILVTVTTVRKDFSNR